MIYYVSETSLQLIKEVVIHKQCPVLNENSLQHIKFQYEILSSQVYEFVKYDTVREYH